MAVASSSALSLPSTSSSEIQALWQSRAALEDMRMNNKQCHTLQLTFVAFVASRTSIFCLEVESSRKVLVVSAKSSFVTVAEMLLMHCLNVLEGEVPNVYLCPV